MVQVASTAAKHKGRLSHRQAFAIGTCYPADVAICVASHGSLRWREVGVGCGVVCERLAQRTIAVTSPDFNDCAAIIDIG